MPTETVVAAFHFFRDMCEEIIRWKVRILMGDANMGNYAVTTALAAHKLSAHILAYHAEYVHERDLKKQRGKPNPRQLKFDSCAIWSVGPIKKIKLQGLAKHCRAVASRGGCRCLFSVSRRSDCERSTSQQRRSCRDR